MHAPVFVRDSDELLRRAYPKSRTATPSGWSCASSTARSRGRLLEVEAVTPRLPGRARLPSRRRGLLPRLAGARASLSHNRAMSATVESAAGERFAPANGIELAYDELGDPGGRPAAPDHGPRDPDDPLGRGLLRAARRARLPGDPLRQPRHRPLDQDRRRRCRSDRGDAARPRPPGLPAARHGRRHGRPARPPRDRARPRRRRLDGRDDRPAAGDRAPRAGALAVLDHVDDRQPPARSAALARLRLAAGEAAVGAARATSSRR